MGKAVTLAAVLSCLPGAALAQPGDLTPRMSLRLLVEVRSISLDGRGQPEPALPAAGTIMGERNDTLYVVTSHHHVESAARVKVRVTPEGPLLPASIPFENDTLDIAVLAVTGHRADASWKLPTRVPRAVEGFEPGETVFAIGCPEGRCWVAPERGQLSGHREYTVQFRTYYLKPGVSGGPLVDAHGALMGITVVRNEVAEGSAVWWPTITSILRPLGFPVDLPLQRGFRVGEGAVRMFGAAFPAPGRDTYGNRILPGWRVEFAYRVAPRIELVGGMSMVSFSAVPLDPEADYSEAYVHPYIHGGARYHFPLPDRSLGRKLPDVLSVGVDLLVPIWAETFVVGMADSDSVDLESGEYVPVRSTIKTDAGTSLAGRLSYRVALGERLALIAATSAYVANFEYPVRSPVRGVLELGAEYRSP